MSTTSSDTINPDNLFEFSPVLILQVKKLQNDVPALKKAYDTPACVDIPIIRLIKIEDGIAYFGTGYAFKPPYGYYVELHPRSSCVKKGWTLANCTGIIDEDYRGEIIVALQPISSLATITGIRLSRIGDNNEIICPSADEIVGHLVKELVLPCSIVQFCIKRKDDFVIAVEKVLDSTSRGEGAFGSSN
jgi:dUTPase